MEKEKSSYMLGNEIYKRLILETVTSVNEESSEYELLVAMEKVEELELKIAQNERRERFTTEGLSANDKIDIHSDVITKGGESNNESTTQE